MTQNNYLCETDQFILKPNNQLRQMGQLEIKRNKVNVSQTKQLILKYTYPVIKKVQVKRITEKSNINKIDPFESVRPKTTYLESV